MPDDTSIQPPTSSRVFKLVRQDAVIVRGFGLLSQERQMMISNMRAHSEDPETQGECALSMTSLPGATPDEIAHAASQLVHAQLRWGWCRDIQHAGFVPVEDRPPHVLVFFDRPIRSEDDAAFDRLLAAMPNTKPNPYSDRRRVRKKAR